MPACTRGKDCFCGGKLQTSLALISAYVYVHSTQAQRISKRLRVSLKIERAAVKANFETQTNGG